MGRPGHAYRLLVIHDFFDCNCLANAKDLLRYGSYRCPPGDRVRTPATLDKIRSLTVAEALSAFRECGPIRMPVVGQAPSPFRLLQRRVS